MSVPHEATMYASLIGGQGINRRLNLLTGWQIFLLNLVSYKGFGHTIYLSILKSALTL